MKRTALAVAAVAALAVILFVALRFAPDKGVTAKSKSAWYHESDVALLATTGRPQLVEFFHPN